ncbi:PepSY-associated TM helix domain-containing protein [Spirosoma arcticum]
MTFKKLTANRIVGKLHLWLGLACGLVVLVSMTAAAVFAWDHELTEGYYGDYVFVTPQTTAPLPLDRLWQNAQRAVPGHPIEGVQVWADPRRAYVFGTYQNRPDTAPGWTHWDDYEYWECVYVDPYTGRVLGVVDMLLNPIDLTRRLHQNLLLRHDIGHYIVGFATLFVIILSLTGLVLWWPKNKAALKQRFSVKWNAKWRRVNYDVHNIGGFYTHLFILLFAATGLVWTFKWWTNSIYRLLGNDPKTVFAANQHPEPDRLAGAGQWPKETALRHMKGQRPTWTEANLGAVKPKKGGGGEELSAFLRFSAPGWDNSDQLFYHAQTGALLHRVRQEDKSTGAAWRNSNYAIHVGSIYGWPTKVLSSGAALFLASLPVTGFLIWWGRRKKAKKARPAIREQPFPTPRSLPAHSTHS